MIKLLSVPFAVAAVTLPVVNGPLPGIPVPLTPAARKAGVVEMRQVAVTGSGAQRVQLYVGRGGHGELCLGSLRFFRCLTKDDAQPAYMLAAYGGVGSSRQWGAVVGLLGREISRVEISRQDNGRPAVQHVRSFPGFPWRVVTTPPSGPNGRLPGSVDLVGRDSTSKVFVDMFGVASACLTRGRSCARVGRSWKVVGDSPMAPVGVTDPRLRTARGLALHDALLSRVIGTATRIVEVAPWTSCGRKFLGAGIHILLFRPITVKGDFPFTSFGKEKRDRAYAEGVVHYDEDGIDEVNVQVDLKRHVVVGISPSGTDVHTRSYRIVKYPTPAGPPDKAACQQGD